MLGHGLARECAQAMTPALLISAFAELTQKTIARHSQGGYARIRALAHRWNGIFTGISRNNVS